MANVSAFGLRPARKMGGNPENSSTTRYPLQLATGDGTGIAGLSASIFQGDMVIPLNTGLLGNSAADGGSVDLIGVFNGCEYIDLDGKPRFSNHWPGAASVKDDTDAWGFVYDDPMQIFEIATDASITDRATAYAATFANAEGASFASGTASTGISTGALAVSTIAETATDNFRIVGVKDDANPDYTAAGVILLVRLNLPAIEDATGINS